VKVIDLFCGAGGFTEGFKQAGFEIILGVDNNPEALYTHYLNHPDTLHWLIDVQQITQIPKCDVLIGSPPCQSFSAGSILQGKRDFRDENLIDEFFRILQLSRAKYFCMENVRGARGHSLYLYEPKVLNACDFGVMQWRKRIFVANFPLPHSPSAKLSKRPDNTISPCILASEFKGTSSDCKRRFTSWFVEKNGRKPEVEDLKEYMGFPRNYQFYGTKTEQGTQIGNAVCPPVAKAIAEALLSHIDNGGR